MVMYTVNEAWLFLAIWAWYKRLFFCIVVAIKKQSTPLEARPLTGSNQFPRQRTEKP